MELCCLSRFAKESGASSLCRILFLRHLPHVCWEELTGCDIDDINNPKNTPKQPPVRSFQHAHAGVPQINLIRRQESIRSGCCLVFHFWSSFQLRVMCCRFIYHHLIVSQVLANNSIIYSFKKGVFYVLFTSSTRSAPSTTDEKEIAGLLDIDQRVYSTYETGKREIPLRHLVALAKYYHTSTDYLLWSYRYSHPPTLKNTKKALLSFCSCRKKQRSVFMQFSF